MEPQPSRRMLTLAELRRDKPDRNTFLSLPRRPITVLLDGVHQHHNVGAIFRLCDAFLVQRLVIAGFSPDMRNRRLLKAAKGTQRWVPYSVADSAFDVVRSAKAFGMYIVAAEQTAASLGPASFIGEFPVLLVLGGETSGVSQPVLDWADTIIAIPMQGMANSINVATAAAILLQELSQRMNRSGA